MIRHILKDGTVLDDITGLTVTREQNGELYALLQQKGKERNDRNFSGNAGSRMAEA